MFLVEVLPATKIPLSQPQIYTYYTSLNISRGSLILIPIGKRLTEGLVIETRELGKEKMSIKHLGYELRNVNKILFNGQFLSNEQIELVKWMAEYYNIPLGLSLKTFMPKMPKKLEVSSKEDNLKNETAPKSVFTELPPKLKEISRQILSSDRHILLHNKNNLDLKELYAGLLLEMVKKQKQSLILAPAIDSARKFKDELYEYFKNEIALLNKDSSGKKYFETWQKIKIGRAKIILGTRSAVFAPFANLGLIVIKSEQSASYKNWDQSPKYNSKTVALKLSRQTNAKIIFESAAPSIETYYCAAKNNIKLIDIPESEKLDSENSNMEIIDMREELRGGNFSIISQRLKNGITDALAAKEKVILFINRRGMSTAVICRDCGAIIKCPLCDASMIYHRLAEKREMLLCHYCDLKKPIPLLCPKCQSYKIKYIGTGTQKVAESLKSLFPKAEIKRIDSDISRSKKITAENKGEIKKIDADIIVGTQMIIGLSAIKKFALAGIINVDTMLHLPDFRAGEITSQLICQLSNMAEKTIIQTYSPDNYVIGSAAKKDYKKFFEKEIADRKSLSYPPFSRLIKLIYAHKNNLKSKQETKLLALKLSSFLKKLPQEISNQTEILGPAPAYVYKIKNRYLWQILIKLKSKNEKVKNDLLSLVPDGWFIDIDPISLL